MRKFVLIAIFSLAISILLALYLALGYPTYAVYEENGTWYLELLRDISHPHADSTVDFCNSFEARQYPEFDSVQDMASSVKGGKLTAYDLYYLVAEEPIQLRLDQSRGAKIQICDMESLYIPVLPDGLLLQETVSFYGSRYRLYLDKEACGFDGDILISYPTNDLSHQTQSAEDNILHRISLNNDTAKKTAKAILRDFYEDFLPDSKGNVCYQLDIITKTFSITEYDEAKYGMPAMSIKFWEGDVRIDVTLSGLDEYPTMEWLAAFGVRPVE